MYSFVKAVDSRVDNRPPSYVLYEAVPAVSYNSYIPANVSLNPVITINTPSASQGISRTIIFNATATITLTGTNMQNFLTEQCLSLRAFPLHQCMTNCSIQLGTANVNLQPFQYASALINVNNPTKTQSASQSGTASAPDVCTSYSDIVGFVGSPFACGFDELQSDDCNSIRKAQIVSVTPNNGGVASTALVVVLNVSEPLMCSPFQYTGEGKSIFGLDTLIFNFSFAYLQRMLSYAIPAGATVTSSTGVFNSQALQCSFIAPSEDSVSSIGNPSIYNWTQIQSNTTVYAPAVPSQSVFNVSTNSVQYSIIPSYFLIYATPSVADLTGTTSLPDFFFPIQSLNVNYGMRTGIFGGATPYQLFETAKRNGISANYPRFNGATINDSTGFRGVFGGCPMVINVSKDLQLPANLTSGMSYQTTFSATLQFLNNTASAYGNIQIQVIALTDGFIEIVPSGSVNTVAGNVTKADLAKANELPMLSEASIRNEADESGYSGGSSYGGKFNWGSIRDAFRPVQKAFSAVAPALSAMNPELAPMIMGAQGINKALGGAKYARGSMRNAIRQGMY